MGRALDAGKAHPDRTILSNRFRTLRYPLLAALALWGWIVIVSSLWTPWGLAPAVLLALLLYAVTHTRRAQFDDQALYFLRSGRPEERIPFTAITAIKATGTKLNVRRVWRIEYKDTEGHAKSYRFLPRTVFDWPYSSTNILGWPSDFLDAVDAANPDVVIWWSPFFFHDQPWRQKFQEEKDARKR